MYHPPGHRLVHALHCTFRPMARLPAELMLERRDMGIFFSMPLRVRSST